MEKILTGLGYNMNISKELDVIKEAFKDDGFVISYQSNIAMAMLDAFDQADLVAIPYNRARTIANIGADNFMKRWLDVDCNKAYDGVDRSFVDQIEQNKLSASEAIYGFASWLTTRNEITEMGADKECSVIANLVEEFRTANKLEHPRDNWTDYLTHPKTEETK